MVGKQCLGKDGQVAEAVAYWTMVASDKVVLLHYMHLCLCLCPAPTRPISMGPTSETGQAWLRVVLLDTMLV